ncbi:MAG: TIM barrel protein [Bacteroidetes bacterium]|nr:TIM barrel protein [Bacteroidota bacterium]
MRSTRRQFIERPFEALFKSFSQLDDAMKLGLVTYLWGQDWDLSELIHNCQETGFEGVELRTEHAHGVEIHLSKPQRINVLNQFADSDVVLVGLGTNWSFHHQDAALLAHSISQAKASIILAHDVGASGIKVKPDALPDSVPQEQTIAQIGRSLRGLGEFGEGYGQEIRLEVHGYLTDQLPNIRKIMDATNHSNVRVCWNCNETDLNELGLESNFNLVRPDFGRTIHVRELDGKSYPYSQLFNLLVASQYQGWVLLEARTNPPDRIVALRHQRSLFDTLLELSQKN